MSEYQRKLIANAINIENKKQNQTNLFVNIRIEETKKHKGNI